MKDPWRRFSVFIALAQNDLQRAADIARSMIAEYSMSDLLGPVTCERPRQPMFLPENYTPAKPTAKRGPARSTKRSPG